MSFRVNKLAASWLHHNFGTSLTIAVSFFFQLLGVNETNEFIAHLLEQFFFHFWSFILVNFLKVFEYNIDHFSRNKNRKIVFVICYMTHLFGPKPPKYWDSTIRKRKSLTGLECFQNQFLFSFCLCIYLRETHLLGLRIFKIYFYYLRAITSLLHKSGN